MTEAELMKRIEARALDPPVTWPSGDFNFRIRPEPQVLDDLMAHAAAHPDTEVGGLLFGDVPVDGNKVSVLVTGSVPAEAEDSGPAHIIFTHETWERIRERRRTEHRDKKVVGWYHSHPGFGVFLSHTDLIMHEQIFGHMPWSVAVVLDPVHGSLAFFHPYLEDRTVRCEGALLGLSFLAVRRYNGGNTDGHCESRDQEFRWQVDL